ncbi:hypothetical protein [Risungbinella massiliensis]|uniref:hypothetical protein n=1 Tax=Risungbinella massiliensis TaxID=1329796 RepID=UPI0005CB804F|nr:hypothetical protein [Risungbinella massiliensis]
MKLFHYHHWLTELEEMETFYRELGFVVQLRLGRKKGGSWESIDPTLSWEEIKEQKILFRIIEMRRGVLNVTFGFGKETKFDHIGFLVGTSEKEKICQKASSFGWKIDDSRETRTFLQLPNDFRVELQEDPSYVGEDPLPKLTELAITLPEIEQVEQMRELFSVPELEIEVGEEILLERVLLDDRDDYYLVDPTGVFIVGKSAGEFRI